MKSIEVLGKTHEEALEKALKELNVTEDKVTVEVIEAGSKGLFNFIGGKPTKLKVTIKNDASVIAKEFLSKVLSSMNINAQFDINENKEEIDIKISGNSMGTVIGYRGETLDSLQYLTSLVVNKNGKENGEEYKRVVLDAENYRQKRQDTLKRVAEKTAYKVIHSKRAYKLEPMNPYERRIIHSTLQGREDIYTFSEGAEPHRRVVVDIKRD